MKDDYKSIFRDLKSNINVEGGCVVTRDGLLIYSDLVDIHPEVFAAMSAVLLSSAEVAMSEIKGGLPVGVIVEGKKKIIAMGAGSKALLAIVVSGDVDYEEILNAAKRIEKILEKK